MPKREHGGRSDYINEREKPITTMNDKIIIEVSKIGKTVALRSHSEDGKMRASYRPADNVAEITQDFHTEIREWLEEGDLSEFIKQIPLSKKEKHERKMGVSYP
jgi:hypothetical protein